MTFEEYWKANQTTHINWSPAMYIEIARSAWLAAQSPADEDKKLRKELDDVRIQNAWLKRREDILRTQFAFYVQHGQTVDAADEFPKL